MQSLWTFRYLIWKRELPPEEVPVARGILRNIYLNPNDGKSH